MMVWDILPYKEEILREREKSGYDARTANMILQEITNQIHELERKQYGLYQVGMPGWANEYLKEELALRKIKRKIEAVLKKK